MVTPGLFIPDEGMPGRVRVGQNANRTTVSSPLTHRRRRERTAAAAHLAPDHDYPAGVIGEAYSPAGRLTG